MDHETAKAIADVTKRLNDVEKQLETFLLGKYEENKRSIATTDGGIVDIAEIVSTHDETIAELAELVAAGQEVQNG